MIEEKGYLFFLILLIFLPFFVKKLINTKKYFKNPDNFNFHFGIKSYINFTIRVVVFILVVIALAGPLIPDKSSLQFGEGMNTIFVVDISKSMDCQDIKPSRLEVAKNIMKSFVKEANFDKIGIILFADKSIFYCPPTSDQEALSIFIDNINTDIIPSGGTSLNSGLQRALYVLNKKKLKGNVVLLSDGEDLENEDLSDILSQYKKDNIKIFTIGLGTKKGGKIPYYIQDFFFKRKAYKKYHGQIVITKLNENNLKKIAKKTQGMYFNYKDINGKKLYKILRRKSFKMKNKKLFYMTKNVYYIYLTIAFILYVFSIILMWI